MKRYSTKHKDAVLSQLLPPYNMPVAQIAQKESIASGALYNWRDKAKRLGLPAAGKTTISEHWSAEVKLAVVIETGVMNASELGEYGRAKGLFVEQIERWKEDCLADFQTTKEQKKLVLRQAKADKGEIKTLKK